MSYTAPTKDMEFVLNELADLSGVAALPGYGDATPDLVSAVLEEAGKLASEVLAPLNRIGDEQGSRLEGDVVKTPDGWKEAYEQFIAGGWNGLAFSPELGGQGLPWLVSTAVQEMWHAANMSFGLCPLLTQGAIEAIELHGSDAMKAAYLEKMVSGEWTGTMNLTEPQAGSDLSAVRAKAEPNGDHYLISGQKIFITYGDHELTENIIHLVLARTPDAPEGTKGISLFIVPKYMLNTDGTPGERNDVRTVSLEHKLGIHASPTAVLSYGDNGGAVGYLVGEENRGLVYMFTMMNLARHAVGVEGIAIAERAYQQALNFSKERVQGRALDGSAERVTIIHHPDVQRMLMTMRSQIEATRSVAYLSASAFDKALHHPDEEERKRQQGLMELLTPIVKGWSTEVGNEVTYLGVQIHGGMGFIEETGAAQHYRDARITTIYEGTTGIQAGDLVGRKVLRDGGAVARAVMAQMRADCEELSSINGLKSIKHSLEQGINALEKSTEWVLQSVSKDPELSAAAASPYLLLWGTVVGGWQLARAATVASEKMGLGGDDNFYQDKINSAKFYAANILPQASAFEIAITEGSQTVLEFEAT